MLKRSTSKCHKDLSSAHFELAFLLHAIISPFQNLLAFSLPLQAKPLMDKTNFFMHTLYELI